jgi:hypothetical protein
MSGLDSRFTYTRNSIATFINSRGLVEQVTAAATNDPTKARFDYDPTTLAPRGLLIEGSVTNLCERSEDMSNTSHWVVRTNLVTTSWTGFTGPDNSTNAVRLVPNTTSGRHTLEHTAITLVNGTTYTASCWFKADGYTAAAIVATNNQTRRNFVLTGTGSPGSQFGPISNTATVTAYPNGWYRCTMTWTSSVTTADLWIGVPQNSTNDVVNSWAGNGTDGVQAFGAQLEASSTATSYIPTGASTVQRAADSCQLTGANFSSWFNATQGTFFARGQRRLTSNTGMLLSANNATNSEAMGLGSSTTGRWLIRDNGSDVASISPGTVTANTTYRIAGAYAVNDAQAALNSTLGTADTSLTLPTVNQLDIGRDRVSVYLDGYVELIKYWPTRLPNAQLQAITA